MKIPIFECHCQKCGVSRVFALEGARAPERCPVCGSPQTFRIKFIEPDNLNTILPSECPSKVTKSVSKVEPKFLHTVHVVDDIKPLPKRDPGSALIPPEGKFTIVPPPKKRIMQVVILTVLPLIKAVSAHCVDDEGDNGVTVIMPMAEARAKDIRLGDIVEVEDKKILRVLLEKRGENNAKDEKG